MVMVVDSDAENQAVIRVQKAILHTARPMEEGEDASSWDAPKVLRGRLTSALPMVVVHGVGIQGVAPRQPGASQGFALDMVGVRDVTWRDALGVQKGRPVFASLMGVGGVASLPGAPRGPRATQCSAKHMVVENDASLRGVLRAQRGVHHCARLMVGVNVACLMRVGFAQRVFMVGRTSVWLMAVGRDVAFQGAPKVHVVALTVAFAMVGGKGARLKTAGRAPKEALTFAKPMGAESGVVGEMESVRNLQGGEAGCVQPTTTWLRRVNTSSKA